VTFSFGIYQSKQGDWWTGTAAKQEPLTVPQAVERARIQRGEARFDSG
jgi:hypothetical protein